ncbi:hypothetical protein H0H93_011724 [Arthromyces matolae]|nr:hypothetical protein H0H93_011724 [Arthromyces matolae]
MGNPKVSSNRIVDIVEVPRTPIGRAEAYDISIKRQTLQNNTVSAFLGCFNVLRRSQSITFSDQEPHKDIVKATINVCKVSRLEYTNRLQLEHGMPLTKVPSERQKILGLVKGKLPPDQDRIADLRLVPGKKFTVVGTPEGDEIKDPSQLENLPDVVNDLDVDFSEDVVASATYKNDHRNIRKIKEATDNLNINIIHPLRQGKKLLVLDIDYSAPSAIYLPPFDFYFATAILDTKPLTSGSLPPAECARPFLHEFLEAIYPFYDICIWSQTSWVWLETKLVELGMIGSNHNYQSRNFALNPREGLKIHAFKNAHTPEATADRELHKLMKYLLHIQSTDFRNHRHKHYLRLSLSVVTTLRIPVAFRTMVTATATPVTSQTPRPSASLVILNSRNEVLLVHRNPKARHFGGVHVFPGGNYDRKQDPSFAMTAIRETFEESGILLASSTLGSTNHVSAELLDEARHKIHSQQLNFRDFLQSQCMKPDVDSLLPFTEWITPVNALRRFHTHFFVAFLPEVSSFSSGVKEERLPKHG